eukprot:363221-Chlamydomonas_euryale.AAC.33
MPLRAQARARPGRRVSGCVLESTRAHAMQVQAGESPGKRRVCGPRAVQLTSRTCAPAPAPAGTDCTPEAHTPTDGSVSATARSHPGCWPIMRPP